MIDEESEETPFLCKILFDLKKDEEKAISDYFELSRRFPEFDIAIESIMDDEKKHKEMLNKIIFKSGCV